MKFYLQFNKNLLKNLIWYSKKQFLFRGVDEFYNKEKVQAWEAISNIIEFQTHFQKTNQESQNSQKSKESKI